MTAPRKTDPAPTQANPNPTITDGKICSCDAIASRRPGHSCQVRVGEGVRVGVILIYTVVLPL
jgi:hypothetical protein